MYAAAWLKPGVIKGSITESYRVWATSELVLTRLVRSRSKKNWRQRHRLPTILVVQATEDDVRWWPRVTEGGQPVRSGLPVVEQLVPSVEAFAIALAEDMMSPDRTDRRTQWTTAFDDEEGTEALT